MTASTVGSEMINNRFTGELKDDLQQRLDRESSLRYSHKGDYLGLTVFHFGRYYVIAESEKEAEEIFKQTQS